MSTSRILVAVSVGVLGCTDLSALAQSASGGGLGGGPPGARSDRTKREIRRARFENAFGPNDTHRFGDPLADLTEEEWDRFLTGRALFEDVKSAAAGLGPAYVARSCTGCHSAPVSAGAGESALVRVTRREADVAVYSAESGLETRPIGDDCDNAGEQRQGLFAVRSTTAVFGAGLIDAISDYAILFGEDPDDLDGDGISGRAHIVSDPYEGVARVGRFGWKAQAATLESFTADSLELHLGITTRLTAHQEGVPGHSASVLNDCDSVEDPEDAPDAANVSDFERIADYLRLLAAPPQRNQNNTLGLTLFQRIGCTGCHTAVMFTDSSDIESLSRRAVALYSDLLLHDMRGSGDGIVQAGAGANEMRTAPLWGLRARPALWHDGRFNAETRVRDAIEAHDGEGTASRDSWLALPDTQQRALLEFLNSI